VLLFLWTLMIWHTNRFHIDLSRPKVMGIVNLTPDSFSDGGQFPSTGAALAQCERLLAEGADILDLGAESSRPGAISLPLEEELGRLLPVLQEAIKMGVPVSIDTYKPAVMLAALDLGADIINDIWGFRRGVDASGLSAIDVVARHSNCGVCIMHMHGEPVTMQLQPMEGEVLQPVKAFLLQRAAVLESAGVLPSRMVLDPGIGFGKTVQQNFSLLKCQAELSAMAYPILVGWSRKSSIGVVTGLSSPAERIVPSVVAAVLAVERGAKVVRVHDVAATIAGLKVLAQ
jgi:dihydropteroate synthase